MLIFMHRHPYRYDRVAGFVVGPSIQAVPVTGEFQAAKVIQDLEDRRSRGEPPQPREQRIALASDRLFRALACGARSVSDARQASGGLGTAACAEAVDDLSARGLIVRRGRGVETVLSPAGMAYARKLGITPVPPPDHASAARERIVLELSRQHDGHLTKAAIARRVRSGPDILNAALRALIVSREIVPVFVGRRSLGYRLPTAPRSTAERRRDDLRMRVLERLEAPGVGPLSANAIARALGVQHIDVTTALDELALGLQARRRDTHPKGWVLVDRNDVDFDAPVARTKATRREQAMIEILAVLADAPGPVARDALCFRLGRGAGHVTGYLAELTEAGGVAHVRHGQKAVGYVLTDAGRAALEAVPQAAAGASDPQEAS